MPPELGRGDRSAAAAASAVGQLAALWTRQSWSRRAVAVGIFAALGGAMAWVAVNSRSTPWIAIVTAHHEEEGRECVIALQGDGITTRQRGREIEVAPRDVERARAVLSAAGLPDAGTGLRSFQDAPLMQSGFAELVSYQRALQDELARSIKSLAPIDRARVHLALGKRSIFKGQEEPPSASVAVRVHPGEALTATQIHGIARLVANSVDGMRLEDVAVIDQRGAALEDDDGSAAAKSEVEGLVTAKVRDLLERVLGGGRVAVAVSAELEPHVDEAGDEPGKEAPAPSAAPAASARSSAPTEPTEPTAPAEETVAAGAPPPATTRAGSSAPSRLLAAHGVRAQPRVRRLLLAVAIDARRGADGVRYQPTAAELEQWTRLVRVAAGVDERRGDRVEVTAVPFAVEPPPREAGSSRGLTRWPSRELLAATGAGLLGALGLGLGLAARQRHRHARELRAVERRLEALVAQQAPAAPRASDEGRAPGALERAEEVIGADLDASAAVLTAWLAEGASTLADREAGGSGAPSAGLPRGSAS